MRIGNHDWKILIVSREDINGDDGQCDTTTFTIKIAEEMKGEMRLVIFIHELTHAILNTQGRHYQKRFELEELCEFVAWNFDEIERCVNEFVEEIGL